MFLLTIISIALALSVDTFAVSTVGGCTCAKVKTSNKIIAATSFAFCQTLLTFVGWFFGENAYNLIEDVVRIVAFLLLLFIGLKMCFDAFSKKEEECVKNFLSPICLKTLLVLGIATSIDALAVGVSFAFTKTPIIPSCITIFAITFFVSLLGIELGKYVANKTKRLPFLGGIILLVIAILTILE